MPITFSCDCGKQMQAKDEFAGRRMKCPICQKILTIPAPEEAATVTLAEPPPPTPVAPEPETAEPEAPPIRFYCSCGKQLQASGSNAGRKMRCSGCGAVLTIPDQDEEPPYQAEEAPQEQAAVPNPWAAVSLDQHLTPWRDERTEREYGDNADLAPPSRALLVALLLLLLLGGTAAAGWYYWADITKYARDAEHAQAAVEPELSDLDFVPPDALGLIAVRVADGWNSPMARPLRDQLERGGPAAAGLPQLGGLSPAEVERVTVVLLEAPPSKLKNANAPSWLMLVNTTAPYNKDRLRQALTGSTLLPGQPEPKVFQIGKTPQMGGVFLTPKVFVIGEAMSLGQFLNKPREPSVKGRLSGIIEQAAAGKHLVFAGGPLHKAASDFAGQQNLPAEARADLKHLAFRELTLTVDIKQQLDFDLRLGFADDAAADKAKEVVAELLQEGSKLLAALKQEKEQSMAKALELAEDVSAAVKMVTRGKDLHVSLQVSEDTMTRATALAAGMAPAVQKVREPAQRTVALNNLRQIGLAMYSYHDVYKTFPPAVVGKGLSWRVALLPFLEQQQLYQQFKLDELWDSPDNIKLLPQMPKVFAASGDASEPGTTHYQVFNGPGAAFEGSQAMRIADFRDGTANTLLVVEAADAVPWTKPADLPFGPQQPLPRLGALVRGRFLAVMADGTVRVISASLGDDVLRAYITRAGGEPVPSLDK